MTITRMTAARFDALAGWGRAPGTRGTLRNGQAWSTSDGRLLGTTYYAPDTDVFAVIVLARDRHGCFRVFDFDGAYLTGRGAEAALRARLAALAGEPTPDVPLPAGARQGIDLFAALPGVERLNAKFVNLRDRPAPSAARELLREMTAWLPDVDGNFVRDFQTAGTDARVWELYLWAVLTELDFAMDRTTNVPDFCLEKAGAKLFIEAVTANPTGGGETDIRGAPPLPPEDLRHYIENEMAQKFGSPLFSKLKKRYWEADHVAGHPFLLAIADFHSPASMVWSKSALPAYLYGLGGEVRTDDDGRRYGVERSIDAHVVGAKVVPSRFFEQPDTEHVSAVLFSNAGTLAKFNRMGVLAGFGDPNVTLIRKGGFNDHRPGAVDPIPFKINVEDPSYAEGWADEIEIYHNPRALVPLDEAIFEGATQYFVEDGEAVWRGPSPRVLFSCTHTTAHLPARTETDEAT